MSNSRKSPSDFPVGSVVEILQISKLYCERSSVGWINSMKNRIGTLGIVVKKSGSTLDVEFDDGDTYHYTPGCLKLRSVSVNLTINNDIFYHIGQIFEYKSGELYILSEIDSAYRVALICLNDGRRWEDSKYVGDLSRITKDEMLLINSNRNNDFTLLYNSYADLTIGKKVKNDRFVIFESISEMRYNTAEEFEKETGYKFIRFAK